MPSLLVDLTPLRRSPSFRRLWLGLSVGSLGSQLTVVGVSYQTYLLTHSTAMVGLVSLAGLLPTLVGSLIGGAIADSTDRRRLLIATQILLAAASASLAANALLPHPQVWVLFVAPSAIACLQGVDWPTRLAAVPMLVGAEDLSSAFALQSMVNNLAMVAGPALAGLLIGRLGVTSVYMADVASYGATLIAACRLPALVPSGGGTAPGVASIVEGLRYLRTQKLLTATFALDFNAMVFGMPKAVFPALGTRLFHGGASTVGLLYAAPGAGALLASMASGWVRHISARGRALVVCMLVWGAAMVGVGSIAELWVGLVLLAAAGGADIIGGVFRVAILQTTTPEELQGRLSGVFFAAAVSGNRLGDGESGLAASLGGSQFAVWSGGLACVVGTALLAWRIPGLWSDRQPRGRQPRGRQPRRSAVP
ncbi:MAG: MFS transporter [Actinomycetota bacterium]|nr:MFS transporter [Actinomycetota bacterium]